MCAPRQHLQFSLDCRICIPNLTVRCAHPRFCDFYITLAPYKRRTLLYGFAITRPPSRSTHRFRHAERCRHRCFGIRRYFCGRRLHFRYLVVQLSNCSMQKRRGILEPSPNTSSEHTAHAANADDWLHEDLRDGHPGYSRGNSDKCTARGRRGSICFRSWASRASRPTG